MTSPLHGPILFENCIARINEEAELTKERDDLCKQLMDDLDKICDIQKKDTITNEMREEIDSLKCEMDEISKKLMWYTVENIKKALDILEFDNPLNYIMCQYKKMHLGDAEIGEILILSYINSCILNTEGLQPKLSGASGKGKTHAVKSIYHLIPTCYKIEGSLSAKSMFYMNLAEGKIVFSDDIKMNEDLESTLKISMTNFQQPTYHHTIINSEYKELTIPCRICWWLTSVKSDFSDELVNRLYDQNVDESAAMDKKVCDNTFKRAATGELAFPENKDIEICRFMLYIIKRKKFQVKIPYGSKIDWHIHGDRRNPSRFVSLIMGYTVLNFLQREKDNDYILANIQDFENAKSLYEKGKENQITKLSKAELKLTKFLGTLNEYVSINDLVKIYLKENGEKYTYMALKKLIVGEQNKNKPGLIDKVPGMYKQQMNGEHKYYLPEFKSYTKEIVSMKSDISDY